MTAEPPPFDLFVSHDEEDAAWVEGLLAAALRAGGARVLIEAAFDVGVPRLVEFERALRSASRVLLVLSRRREPSALRAFVSQMAQCYHLEGGSGAVALLVLEAVELPPHLRPLRAFRSRSRRGAELDAALREVREWLGQPPPLDARKPDCPYPGLAPYTRAQRGLFFGREQDAARLADVLRRHRRAFLIGPSGSGKSSLIAAALVPEVEERDGARTLVRSIRPGAAPPDALRGALGAADLAGVGPAAADALLQREGKDHLLLIIDQFEETFAATPPQGTPPASRTVAALTIEALLRLAAAERVTLLVSMRADYYPELMTSALWPVPPEQRVELAPLRGAALTEAVGEPSRRVGVQLDEAFVQRLIADGRDEPGVLPLVQETMRLLWESMPHRHISLPDYLALGEEGGGTGLAVALARRADAVFGALDAARQRDARRLFLQLVQFGDGRAHARRQRRIGDLVLEGLSEQDVTRTVEYFVASRLLTVSGDAGAPDRRVDIAHEALIVAWPRFVEWCRVHRRAEETRRLLDTKLREWLRLERRGGELDDAELAEAEQWVASDDARDVGFDPLLRELIAHSRDLVDRRRRRLKQAAAGFALLSVLAAGAALVALQQRDVARTQTAEAERQKRIAFDNERVAKANEQEKERQRQLAVDNEREAALQRAAAERRATIALSRQLAARSTALGTDQLDLALLLAIEAYDRAPTVEAEASVLAAIQRAPRLVTLLSGHEAPVTALSWAPSGDRLVSGSLDRTVRTWTKDAGGAWAAAATLVGHEAIVLAVLLRDGQVVSGDASGALRVWDVDTGRSLAVQAHEGPVLTLMDLGDGTFASGGEDGWIASWDPRALSQGAAAARRWRAHDGGVWCAALHAGGARLITGSDDGTIKQWDLRADPPALVREGREHQQPVTTLAIGPGEHILVSGGNDRFVAIWNLAEWEVFRRMPAPEGARQLAWRPAAPPRLAISTNERDVSLVQLGRDGAPPIELPALHQGHINALSFAPDGSALATAGDDERIAIWNVEEAEPVPLARELPRRGAWDCAVVRDAVALGRDGRVEVASLAELAGAPRVLTGPNGQVWKVTFSPDGDVLAAGDEGGLLHCWRAADGTPIGSVRTPGAVHALAFSPTEPVVATGSFGGVVVTWALPGLTPLVRIETRSEREVDGLAFTPDGKTLLAGVDARILRYDAATGAALPPLELPRTFDRGQGHLLLDGNRLKVLRAPPSGAMWDDVHTLEWLSQEHLIAASYMRSAVVWDVAAGRPRQVPLEGQPTGISSLAVGWRATPGTGAAPLPIAATGGWDGAILLWDVDAGERLGRPLRGHQAAVNGLAFAGGARLLVSVDSDRLLLWDTSIDSWQRRARHIAGRPLSPAERSTFGLDAGAPDPPR